MLLSIGAPAQSRRQGLSVPADIRHYRAEWTWKWRGGEHNLTTIASLVKQIIDSSIELGDGCVLLTRIVPRGALFSCEVVGARDV